MKKVLSVLLSIILMLAIFPTGIFTITANAATSGYYTYTVSNREATITSVNTSISGNVTIPTTLGGYTVSGIDAASFAYCTNITSVTIGDSITNIGSFSFSGCTRLTTVTIGKGVKTIGGFLFSDCTNLTTVNFNATSCKDMPRAFNDCTSITTVNIGDNITEIPNFTFNGLTNLTNITLPNSIVSVAWYAFHDCISLKNVWYRGTESEKENISISSNNEGLTNATWHYNSCIGTSEHTYDNGCDLKCNVCDYTRKTTDYSFLTYTITDGEVTITSCDKTFSGELVIPVELEGLPVTAIGEEAFYNCAKINSVIMPDSIVNIGDFAFVNCASLKSVYISANTKTIGYAAFAMSGITNISIPDSVTSIGEYAFQDSELKSITLGKGIKTIDYLAFYNCSQLESVNIRDITSWCYINFISDRSNPLYYAKKLYINGELVTDLVIPNGVTSISDRAFCYFDSLTSVSIPMTATSIGDYAFAYCSFLDSISIPDSVTSIGKYAFYDTSYYNNNANWENNALYIGNHLIRYDDFFANRVTIFIIKDGTKTIASEAFSYCSDSLENVIIPNSVENIGQNVFHACRGLKSVTFPVGITSIEVGMFNNCSGLEEISIPESVVNINDKAFAFCTSLTNISIPSSVENIGYAFAGCSELENIFYRDNKEKKDNINISSDNSYLINATWYYDSCIGTAEHTYDDRLDTICNVCKNVREITHALPGDVDQNGEVDVVDLALLKKIVAGLEESLDLDLNGDGKTDVVDLALLKKIVAGLA